MTTLMMVKIVLLMSEISSQEKKIDQSKYMDMYVVKCQPHRAVLESEYFIKMIEQAEAKRDEEIQRIEAGIDDEAETKKTGQASLGSIDGGETEWEKIQKLPDADYLMMRPKLRKLVKHP